MKKLLSTFLFLTFFGSSKSVFLEKRVLPCWPVTTLKIDRHRPTIESRVIFLILIKNTIFTKIKDTSATDKLITSPNRNDSSMYIYHDASRNTPARGNLCGCISFLWYSQSNYLLCLITKNFIRPHLTKLIQSSILPQYISGRTAKSTPETSTSTARKSVKNCWKRW